MLKRAAFFEHAIASHLFTPAAVEMKLHSRRLSLAASGVVYGKREFQEVDVVLLSGDSPLSVEMRFVFGVLIRDDYYSVSSEDKEKKPASVGRCSKKTNNCCYALIDMVLILNSACWKSRGFSAKDVGMGWRRFCANLAVIFSWSRKSSLSRKKKAKR